MLKKFIISCLTLACALTAGGASASAQEAYQTFSADSLNLKIYFRQGITTYDATYKGNAAAIGVFFNGVNNLMSDKTRMIYTVTAESLASPEGSEELNTNIALERARCIRDLLLENTTLSPYQVKAVSGGTNWEGLRKALLEIDEEWRDEAIRLIDEPHTFVKMNGRTYDSRTLSLQKMHGGVVWKYIMDNIFPLLRCSTVTMKCLLTKQQEKEYYDGSRHYRDTIVISHKDTLYIITEYRGTPGGQDARAKGKKIYKHDADFRQAVFAFKTNLLLPLTNIGIEVPIGNRVSIEAMYYSPWVWRPWMNKVYPYYQNCFQFQGAQLCARIWLGGIHKKKSDPKYRLMGHSIGIGVGGLIYDYGRDYNGQQGNVLAAGLDYTYTLPLGKGNVRMEFSLGVCGYYNYLRDYYAQFTMDKETGEPTSDAVLFGKGDWQKTVGIAPFKCNINLVVPIFQKKKEVTR